MAGRAQASFYTGAIVLQPAAALDAFVADAAPGNEFVYCEAPREQRSAECWLRAGELAQAGMVRTHQRRRAGGGWQWYVVRTAKPRPRDRSPQEKALDDRATAIVFAELKRDALLARPCSSDTELMKKAGLTIRQQAGNRVRALIGVGLIESQQVYDGGVPARVVTILATRHAGAAAGKSTRWPEKYAALRAAAAADAGSSLSRGRSTPTGAAR